MFLCILFVINNNNNNKNNYVFDKTYTRAYTNLL